MRGGHETKKQWTTEILSVKTPKALQRAVFYYIGKRFCIRGGQEQRKYAVLLWCSCHLEHCPTCSGLAKAQYVVVVQLPIQGVGACTSGAALVAVHGFLLMESFSRETLGIWGLGHIQHNMALPCSQVEDDQPPRSILCSCSI